jgi:histidinol-phosphate aminotransferase
VTAREVEEFLAKVPDHVIVCFDEAYVDFVEAEDFPEVLGRVSAGGGPPVVVMRTFSKSYGLAGLRVGYAVGPADLVAYLHKVRQPFNVNAMAQAAATAALDDRFFLWRTKRLVTQGRRFFYKRLRKLGLPFLESQANFVLVNTGHDGEDVFQNLLRQGVIVRSMKPYGLGPWIRVTIGRRSQNSLFLRALQSYLRQTTEGV